MVPTWSKPSPSLVRSDSATQQPKQSHGCTAALAACTQVRSWNPTPAVLHKPCTANYQVPHDNGCSIFMVNYVDHIDCTDIHSPYHLHTPMLHIYLYGFINHLPYQCIHLFVTMDARMKNEASTVMKRKTDVNTW